MEKGEGTNGNLILNKRLIHLLNCFFVINYPLSIIHYPLSIINYPLSIINYPLSIINYPLSIINYPLSIIHYQLERERSVTSI